MMKMIVKAIVVLVCLPTVMMVEAATPREKEVDNPRSTSVAQRPVPFVAGFERFGRHDELEERLAGEVLLSELSCTACHASDSIKAKGGPQLHGIARRVNADWLREFLSSPASKKPGTTMPDVLSGLTPDAKGEVINALIAFFSTLQADYPTIKAGGANPVEFEFWKKGNPAKGIRVYHEVGCVACHTPDSDYEVAEITSSPIDQLLDELDPDELTDMGLAGAARGVDSVPHGDLGSKYSRRSLTRFLYEPEHFRPGGRMPNMKLALDEAADIAAHLLRGHRIDDHVMETSLNKSLIEKGRQFFTSLGCANCHDAGKPTGEMATPAIELNLAKSSRSCLNEQPDSPAVYGLDDQQTAAIVTAVNHLKANSNTQTTQPDPGYLVNRTLLQMNCYGCHTRDELGGVGRYRKGYFETVTGVDMGDEGRLPPPLSGVGRKLVPAWLKRVFRGDPATTLRPHMTIRMPTFPHADVMALSDQFGKADSADNASANEVFGEMAKKPKASEYAKIGQDLMEIGCIQCHEFDGHAMPGVIGVELTGVPDRVYPAWFRDFLMNPGQIKIRTRMPDFFPEGKSQVPNVLDGDTLKQIAAMWSYLREHRQLGIPKKIASERAKNYQLTPTEHPVILRTFMNGVGMHAIAVGFPAGVHFAFDAQQSRLAIGWRKNFLDARSTWFDRFSPLIDPLDTESQTINDGPSFFKTDSGSRIVAVPTQFMGYRLDEERIPTFRYRCGGYMIEDRIVPNENDGLRRSLHIVREKNPDVDHLLFCVIAGEQITRESEQQFRSESGLSVRVVTQTKTPVQNPPLSQTSKWVIPLSESQDLELIYQW